MGLEPTTVVTGEPALSFTYDPKRSLYDQFSKASGAAEGEGELEAAVRRADESMGDEDGKESKEQSSSDNKSDAEGASSEVEDSSKDSDEKGSASPTSAKAKPKSALHGPNSPFFSMFSLFEGSPTYKQRRKKVPKHRSPSAIGVPYLGEGTEDYFGLGGGPGVGLRPAEPQVDRYGRDTTRMSAAEMFLAQARGDFGPQSNPDLIATQKERQRRAMQARADQLAGKGYFGGGMGGVDGMHQQAMRSSPEGMLPGHSPLMDMNGALQLEHERTRPHAEQRHTFPLLNFGQHLQQRSQTYNPQVSGAWPAGAAAAAVAAATNASGSDPIPIPRTKAFVCPLFSCGRMFKRMEHLKRHLRTHTLERPYQCNRCKKRFSRSDNLAQHLRTHARGGDGTDGGAEEADVESEEVDELEGDDAAFEGYMGLGNMPDVQLCEVEIQGQVQEVQGDEEGLVISTTIPHPVSASGSEIVDDSQELYYSDSATSQMVSTPEPYGMSSPGPSRWTQIQTHSPAFSTVSMPSPQMGSSSYPHVSEYISMSAPAHKQTFDHANLYPAPQDINNGPGPIRRHRSATPSVTRFSDTVRRPFTATDGSARSYHPYATPAHSVDNSPMAYSVPLNYEAQIPVVPRSGSHSRSSSSGHQLQDQMHQMLNLEHIESESIAPYTQEPPVVPNHGPYADIYRGNSPNPHGIYRTGSPMQFATASSAYEVDHDPAHSQGMFSITLSDSHPHGYGSHGMDPSYYSSMTHHAVAL